MRSTTRNKTVDSRQSLVGSHSRQSDGRHSRQSESAVQSAVGRPAAVRGQRAHSEGDEASPADGRRDCRPFGGVRRAVGAGVRRDVGGCPGSARRFVPGRRAVCGGPGCVSTRGRGGRASLVGAGRCGTRDGPAPNRRLSGGLRGLVEPRQPAPRRSRRFRPFAATPSGRTGASRKRRRCTKRCWRSTLGIRAPATAAPGRSRRATVLPTR